MHWKWNKTSEVTTTKINEFKRENTKFFRIENKNNMDHNWRYKQINNKKIMKSKWNF